MARVDFGILGSTGLKHFDGYINEEVLQKLRTPRQRAKVFREMADISSTVGAIRHVTGSLVRQVDWRVEAASEEPEAQEWAAFVRGVHSDMSHTFEDYISEVLSMLTFGYAPFEIIYKIRRGDTKDPRTRSQFDDGKIGWRKLSIRGQETIPRWDIHDDGGIGGLYQQDFYGGSHSGRDHPDFGGRRRGAGQEVHIPIDKLILHRTETYKNNPEGRSLYLNAVLDWFYLKRAMEIEAIGMSKDLVGTPVMELPIEYLVPNPSPEKLAVRNDLERFLSQYQNDERVFAMIPSEVDPKSGKPTGFKLRPFASGGTRLFDTTKIKNYYKGSILQSVAMQFLQFGLDTGRGSLALASSMTDLSAVALGSILDIIASVHTRFGIGKLMQINGVPRQFWPKVVHGDIETLPLGELGALLTAMAAADVLPDDTKPLTRKLLEHASLPVPAEDEDETQGQATAAPKPDKAKATPADAAK